MSDFSKDSQMLTEREKSTSPAETSYNTSGYFSQNASLASLAVRDNSAIEGPGPKRGCMGLDIEVELDGREGKDLDVGTVRKIFRENGRLKRFSISPDKSSSNMVTICANADSVSEALRIIKNQNGKGFATNGFKGTLRITQRKERIGLTFLENGPRDYDFSLDRCSKNEMKMVYSPSWYGRESYYMDYEEIWKLNGPYVKPPKPTYPVIPEVARFWQDNCGPDFPDMVARFTAKKKSGKIPKQDMHDFYDRLFNAIFDQELGCAPDEGLVDDQAVVLEERGFSGYVIDVMQHRACGSVMIVEYVPANFSGKRLDLSSDGSDGTGSGSSDEEVGRPAKKPSSSTASTVGGRPLEETQALLKLYAEGGKLQLSAACDWIYGMTVYQDSVFYTRMNCQTCKFQILNSTAVFESAETWRGRRPLWHSVLSGAGYERFQYVVNEMDESVASV